MWGGNWFYKYIYICIYLVKLVQYSAHLTESSTILYAYPANV
jgi:hypothetical protein